MQLTKFHREIISRATMGVVAAGLLYGGVKCLLVAREFAEVTKANKLDMPISYVMMEGYIAGRVIIEAARRQGRAPTREAMTAALNAMNDYDLGGYAVGFRPGARAGSKYVELSIISSEGKIQQ